MHLDFEDKALDDLDFWKKTDRKKLSRIFSILSSIRETPFKGMGKPEKLKHDFKGCWSRRIDKKHRLVYKIEKDKIIIFQCRYHY